MIARLATLAFVLTSIPAAPTSAESTLLTVQLCNGGTIEIELGNENPQAPSGSCHLKACHAGACRPKVKKSI